MVMNLWRDCGKRGMEEWEEGFSLRKPVCRDYKRWLLLHMCRHQHNATRIVIVTIGHGGTWYHQTTLLKLQWLTSERWISLNFVWGIQTPLEKSSKLLSSNFLYLLVVNRDSDRFCHAGSAKLARKCQQNSRLSHPRSLPDLLDWSFGNAKTGLSPSAVFF